jgi:uncharacterized protein YhaN
MQEPSQDFLTRAVGYVVGFVGLGGLLGYLQYRLAARRAPVDMRLADAQAEVQHATAEEIRAKLKREDENSLILGIRAVAQELRAEVERLRNERDKAESEVKMLETQLTREVRWRKLNNWPEPPNEQ